MFGCKERRSKNKLVQRAREITKKDGEMTNRIAELGRCVRRAALQALLEHERQQYVIELNRLGKAIYKQRV
ncbi:unnamed protein product [Coregonus sp. 'balchen']|nr:unnamed protein product [Coregonus sp. 'balchen']